MCSSRVSGWQWHDQCRQLTECLGPTVLGRRPGVLGPYCRGINRAGGTGRWPGGQAAPGEAPAPVHCSPHPRPSLRPQEPQGAALVSRKQETRGAQRQSAWPVCLSRPRAGAGPCSEGPPVVRWPGLRARAPTVECEGECPFPRERQIFSGP